MLANCDARRIPRSRAQCVHPTGGAAAWCVGGRLRGARQRGGSDRGRSTKTTLLVAAASCSTRLGWRSRAAARRQQPRARERRAPCALERRRRLLAAAAHDALTTKAT